VTPEVTVSEYPTGPVPTVGRGGPGSPVALPGARPELPPNVIWRWLGEGIRPYLGWVSLAVGTILLVVGWYEIAGTSVVAKQIPYLASCGLGGMAFVVFGARFLMIQDLRRDSGRLDRLETMVAELHAVLIARGTATAAPVETTASNGSPSYVVLPGGGTYHLSGCPVLEGKGSASAVKPSVVARRGLTPCPLCEPAAVSAPPAAKAGRA
jgi:hypothetical protein